MGLNLISFGPRQDFRGPPKIEAFQRDAKVCSFRFSRPDGLKRVGDASTGMQSWRKDNSDGCQRFHVQPVRKEEPILVIKLPQQKNGHLKPSPGHTGPSLPPRAPRDKI